MKYFLTVAVAAAIFFVRASSAQIFMSAGTNYSQNFDALASAGGTMNWTNNLTLAGWYAAKGATDAVTYVAGAGTGTAGSIYSFGTNGVNAAADRALGSVAASSLNYAYGVRFTNDTLFMAMGLTISYTGEQWRNANTITNTLAFSYQVASQPLTNADANNSQAWISFNTLDFNSPNTNGGTALDGNNATNRQSFTNIVLTGVSVLPGQEIFLRWRDIDDNGSDAAMAVDDLTVSFGTNAVPAALPVSSIMGTRTLRIAAYNIEADIGVTNKQATFTNLVTSAAVGPPLPGLISPPTNSTAVQLGGVLEGMGEELENGNAQPLDILALEETTSNPATIAPIVNGLNTFYGVTGMYSNSSFQATESGNDPAVGNGPNAIIFNTLTVQLLASTPVTPSGGTSKLGSGSGEYREVMRYEFSPAGTAAGSNNIFYIYVSHYKSGGSASDETSRTGEAQIIRTNEALDLPATARVLYVGDYNITSNSEASYQIIVSNTAPNGVVQGAGVDPLYPANDQIINWHKSTTDTNLLAQESDNCEFITYRDDLQTMTANVFSGADSGLKYIAGTYHTFGNNGSIAYSASVNNANNTALNGRLATNGPVFISAAQIYVDLTGGSDHLPIVADYTIPIPAPQIAGANLSGTNLIFSVTGGITNAACILLMNTNLSTPLANWAAVASNTAATGNFSFTATNVFSPTTRQRFFILQTR